MLASSKFLDSDKYLLYAQGRKAESVALYEQAIGFYTGLGFLDSNISILDLKNRIAAPPMRTPTLTQKPTPKPTPTPTPAPTPKRTFASTNWLSTAESHIVGLKADGTVVAAGDNNYGQCEVSGWKLF